MPNDFPPNEGLDFTVMPQTEEPSSPAEKNLLSKFSLSPSFKIAIAVAVAGLLLGGAGYFAYLKFLRVPAPASPQPIPQIEIPVPGDTILDRDKDGLTDKEELTLLTNPQRADSDNDGLADGDEKNVYGSDPLLPDTDGDSFDDGREVARGYSPVVSSSEKASASEVATWTEAIAKFGLHEPTPTTLKLKAASTPEQRQTYQNAAFGYAFELPGVLTHREGIDGREVGIYIADTQVIDPDLASDPIYISVAVKVQGQSLMDWVLGQYPQTDYQSLLEQEINNLSAIRLRTVKNEVCPQDLAFFSKDSTVIVLTWTCNESVAFGELYEQIVQSFRFAN